MHFFFLLLFVQMYCILYVLLVRKNKLLFFLFFFFFFLLQISFAAFFVEVGERMGWAVSSLCLGTSLFRAPGLGARSCPGVPPIPQEGNLLPAPREQPFPSTHHVFAFKGKQRAVPRACEEPGAARCCSRSGSCIRRNMSVFTLAGKQSAGLGMLSGFGVLC